MGRKVTPVHEDFFNDGHWYVLSSSSLGGSGLSAKEITDKLQSDNDEVINDLLSRGICLPLFFDCDCELDSAAFVEGELSKKEESEWIGRLRIKLEVPCGELFLMGGGMEEDFEDALANFEPPNPNYRYFQKLKLEPGTYLIEIYAFLGSFVVNEEWENKDSSTFREWWSKSRPGSEEPQWISSFEEEGYVDSEDYDLQEYIIRITPTEEKVPIPAIHEEYKWVDKYELRSPALCPEGIRKKDYR